MNQVLEKLKAFGGKVKEKLLKVSKKVYITAAVILVLIAAVITLALNNRPYSVLVTDVSSGEASTVMNLLSQWGVTDYKVEGNDTILVPASQEDALRARLIMENVGQSGHYYSGYLESISAISTEAERNKAWILDLQERLRATICSMENVKDAEVFITEGEDQSYVLAQNRVVEASASVKVTMNQGAKLTTQHAAAISQLVTNAVQGLEISRVAIMDDVGNTYSPGTLDNTNDATALKLQLEQEESNRIRSQVVQALSKLYGQDNLDVAVSCVVEVSNSTEDQTLYWLPEYAQNGETGGRGIIGSRLWQWSYTRDGETNAGGIVGTETNADTPNPNFNEYAEMPEDITDGASQADASGQTDYQTNTSQKHIVTTAGYLADCSIAVTINSTVAGDVDVETIRRHTARAAGIVGTVDEETGLEYLADKISVLSAPFYTPPIVGPDIIDNFPVDPWILVAAIAGLVLFLIILTVVLILRHRRKKREEEEEEAAKAAAENDIDALLAAAGVVQSEAGADVMNMQTEKSMELRRDLRQFASDNPEIAAQMIKAWLRGGDENG